MEQAEWLLFTMLEIRFLIAQYLRFRVSHRVDESTVKLLTPDVSFLFSYKHRNRW